MKYLCYIFKLKLKLFLLNQCWKQTFENNVEIKLYKVLYLYHNQKFVFIPRKLIIYTHSLNHNNHYSLDFPF